MHSIGCGEGTDMTVTKVNSLFCVTNKNIINDQYVMDCQPSKSIAWFAQMARDEKVNSKSDARNENLREIKEHGWMQWQRNREYGRRNYAELGVQRYQRILGDAMHARNIERQTQEAMIGCGVLNKMTSLGMPQSYKTI